MTDDEIIALVRAVNDDKLTVDEAVEILLAGPADDAIRDRDQP